MIKIRYALIIQNDGLDVIDTTANLERFGKVVEINRGDEATGFVIESSLADKLKLTFELKKRKHNADRRQRAKIRILSGCGLTNKRSE